MIRPGEHAFDCCCDQCPSRKLPGLEWQKARFVFDARDFVEFVKIWNEGMERLQLAYARRDWLRGESAIEAALRVTSPEEDAARLSRREVVRKAREFSESCGVFRAFREDLEKVLEADHALTSAATEVAVPIVPESLEGVSTAGALDYLDALLASADWQARPMSPKVCPVCCAALIAEGRAVRGAVCQGCVFPSRHEFLSGLGGVHE